jgi:hypothetical protein
LRFKKGAHGRFVFGTTFLKFFLRIEASLLALGFVFVALTGCASGSLLVDISKASWLSTSGSSAQEPANTQFNPRYRYLRVELAGKAPAFMVLGYLDAHPLGDIEVWYSSKGETLKLQNGRVVGAAGLSVTWLRVANPQVPPAWDSISGAGVGFSRFRDELPGYHSAVLEQVFIKQLVQAPVATQTNVLQWFSESYSNMNGKTLPSSFYGLGQCGKKSVVVYSRQCLSTELCLTIQPWPPEKDCS